MFNKANIKTTHAIFAIPFLVLCFYSNSNCAGQNDTGSLSYDQLAVKSSGLYFTSPNVELPDYLKKGPVKLGSVQLSIDSTVELGDLRLWCGGEFIPKRMGYDEGSINAYLRGGIISSYEGEKGNEQSANYTYYNHAWLSNSKNDVQLLKNYRYVIPNATLLNNKKRQIAIHIGSLRVQETHQYFNHFTVGTEVYFWMSSAGIRDVYFVEDSIIEKSITARRPDYVLSSSKNKFHIQFDPYLVSKVLDNKDKTKGIRSCFCSSFSINRWELGKKPETEFSISDTAIHTVRNWEFQLIKVESEASAYNDGKCYCSRKPITDIHWLVRVKRTN